MTDAIQIKNFKCFADQKIPLNRLSVFAGANGGGKSTAIQALLLLRQSIDKFRNWRDKSVSLGKIGEKIKLNEVYHLNLGNSKDITCAGLDSDTMELSVFLENKSVTFKFIASRLHPEISIYAEIDEKSLKNLFSDEFSSLSISSKSFHYLVAERVGPRDVQLISDQDFVTTGHCGEYTGYAMYKSEDSKVDEKRSRHVQTIEKSNLFKKQVEAWMDLIVPGIEIRPELLDAINSARVGLRIKASETDYLKPTNIGFGITYVLPVVVSGLVAPENSMLIVENPEAHLHPLGQSQIGKFLAKIAGAGVQVVLETHSEHVINGIRLAVLRKLVHHDEVTINFFNRDGKSPSPKIETISMNKNADLSSWPQGFLDQEEKDLGEIIKLKRRKK